MSTFSLIYLFTCSSEEVKKVSEFSVLQKGYHAEERIPVKDTIQLRSEKHQECGTNDVRSPIGIGD